MKKEGINSLIVSEAVDDEHSIFLLRMQDRQHHNSLHAAFVDALMDVVNKLLALPSIKVIIFAGLDEVFCSGADADTLSKISQENIKPTDILLTKFILDIPVPTIAAMQGHAIGGGLALGLATDIVLIAEESRYGCSFMNMGFTPGMGITKLLENVLSPVIAHELLYTGELRKGRTFIGSTGFNHILPKQEVMNKSIDIALQIAQKTKTTLEVLKRYLSLQKRRLFEETYTVETLMHDISFSQPGINHLIKEHYIG